MLRTDSEPTPESCPGKTLRMNGSTAAICYGCQRYGARAVASIEPRASLDVTSQVWQCPDRLGAFGYTEQVHA